jgi:membrane protease YdiL (CAAX protease family)
MVMEISDNTSNLRKPVWGFWATSGLSLWVMTVNLAVQLLVLIIFLLINIRYGNDVISMEYFQGLVTDGLFISLATYFSASAAIGIIIFAIRLRKDYSVKEYLGLNRIRIKPILLMLGITAIYVVILNTISVLTGYEGSTFVSDVYKTSVYPVLLWLAMVIFAPAFEEALFRGFMYEGYSQSRIGAAGAVLLTSLLWALLHIQYGFFEISAIFFFGIVLGIARYFTGSLWAPLFMHAFFNLVSMIAVALNIA